MIITTYLADLPQELNGRNWSGRMGGRMEGGRREEEGRMEGGRREEEGRMEGARLGGRMEERREEGKGRRGRRK